MPCRERGSLWVSRDDVMEVSGLGEEQAAV